MALPFDHITTRDSFFSRSAIAQLQRKTVWRYLEKVIPEMRGYDVLELNCGTGDDAKLFSPKGFNLVATDIGCETLKLTDHKQGGFSMQTQISSHYLDLDTFEETFFNRKFDLVFSNFGGLNSINPESFETLLSKLPAILNPGGRFIGLVMPKVCAWETIFFMLRLQFRKAFRRYSEGEKTSSLHGKNLATWYYSPNQIRRWSKGNFKVMALNPVGVVLPALHLERFSTFSKRLLLKLDTIEKKLSNKSLLSGIADNFIVDLKLLH